MKNNRLTKIIAILALFAGMALAFLQGIHVYAAADSADETAIVAQAQNDPVADGVILEDEAIPAAMIPTGVFPWWCYALAIGAAITGLGVYVFINKHTFS